MIFYNFQDILAWQKSKILTLKIYSIFYPLKDFSFSDQIRRSSVSIMNNIAEGFDRGNNEFRRFLCISKGSANETLSMLILAEELNYISKDQSEELKSLAIEICKILNGLIKSLK